MDKYRLSIIIPVYNAEDYLARCVSSIMAQDFDSYEVILVDDGSSDSSSLICDRYSSSDVRIQTIHKNNSGVSSARNAGIELAKGEYLMFVDSDDALMPGALKSMFEGLDGEDMVLGGYVKYIDTLPCKEMIPLRDVSYRENQMDIFFSDNIRRNCEMLDAPWAKMFRRKAVAGLRFSEKLSYAEDKLFVFAFLAACSSVKSVTLPVYAYYVRPGSLGSDLCSDRHLMQLRMFLPAYAAVLCRLEEKYDDNEKVCALYHNDLVGRYICRILNIFLTHKTSLLTEDFLNDLYFMMDKDKRLSVFSLRIGQLFNVMLWRFFSAKTSVKIYKALSCLSSK